MSILDGFKVIRDDKNFIPLTRIANENFDIHTIRPLQEKVYNEYRNEPLFILSEPPGSGKSTTIKFVSTTLLKENPNLISCCYFATQFPKTQSQFASKSQPLLS